MSRDRERAALVLLDAIYGRRVGRVLYDDEMFVEWMDEQIAVFIRTHGPLAEQIRELDTRP